MDILIHDLELLPILTYDHENLCLEKKEPTRDLTDSFVSSGICYLKQEKYDLALVDFNNAIQLDQNSAMLYAYRGLCYFLFAKYDLALDDFEEAIQLEQNSAMLYVNRGLCYLLFAKYDLALDDYEKAIQLDHDSARIYCNRGVYYLNQRKYELALTDFDKAIQLDHDLAAGYGNRCVCYLLQEKYDMALININKAIQLDQNSALKYCNRGVCYLEQKKYNIALVDFDKAIHLDQNYGNAYFGRGTCNFEQQKYDLALEYYEKVIQSHPLEINLLNIYINRGHCYLKQKKYDLAIADFNMAIQLDPDLGEAYGFRGSAYLEQDKYDLAFADYDKLVKLFPDSSDAYNIRGTYYCFTQMSDLAWIDYNKSIELSDSTEDKKEICFRASAYAFAAKKFDKARDYIERAFEYEDSKQQYHKQVYLDNIKWSEKLDEANQTIVEKNKELNNIIAIFAHDFLATLQCIRSNAEHDNNPNIHLKTVKMMSGILTAFSIISADNDKLIEQLQQDNSGEINLAKNLATNLYLAISQLLSKTNKDKIIDIYLSYLKKSKQIENETTGEELRENRDYRKKWQALQHQWEDEFNSFFSEKFSENIELSNLQKWLEDNFFAVEITGFNDCNIKFKEYGITDSIFLVIFMEILVNSLKYIDVTKNKPLSLILCKEDQYYKLVCENPSSQETGRGTHKGIDFLKTIAKKLNGEFYTESTEHSFKSTFTIPAELLE